MKILVLSGYYLPGFKGGGPIKTLTNLIQQTGDVLSYKVITSDRDLGDDSPYDNININDWNRMGKSDVLYVPPSIKGLTKIIYIICKNDYDIIYLNSFFSPKFSILPLFISKSLGKPIVLSPRGEFSQGALSLKAAKKKAFIRIFKILRLKENIVFQASSDQEKRDIEQALGFSSDVYIATNISSKQFPNTLPSKQEDIIKGVIISRISPMKNLLLALDILENTDIPVIYDIYGPIEDIKYWKKCKHKITQLPSHISVNYKGEIHPTEVINTLKCYDFFLMPTKGENYGHAIAEALSAGVPILISNKTPWRNLEQLGIGWDISLDKLDDFSAVINKLAKIPSDEYANMRIHILNWAKKKFAQRDAIESNITMFRYAYNKKKGINNALQK